MTPAAIPFRELAVIFVATAGVVLLAFGDLLALLAITDIEVIDQVIPPETASGAGRPSSPFPPVAAAGLAETGGDGHKQRPLPPLLAMVPGTPARDHRAFSGDAAGPGRQRHF